MRSRRPGRSNPKPPTHRRRASMTRAAIFGLAAWVAATGMGCGPLGPIPGGALRGSVQDPATADWSGVADVEQIQIETRPGDAYSVNVWMGVHEGRLYVPTSLIRGADDPMERTWVKNVLENPDVRVRIEGDIYPLRAGRVEDEDELVAVRTMLLDKYDVDADEHVEQGWIFRLDPR